uniref:ADF-H domain-containing protein n=1 Tax=Percolomonas cosmopolitus TaxID=63605 RepID=A0A7S1PHJ7_9EUKA
MHTNFAIPDNLINAFRTLAQQDTPSQRFLQVTVNHETESFQLNESLSEDVTNLTPDFGSDYANLQKTIENPDKDCSYYMLWVGDYLAKMRGEQQESTNDDSSNRSSQQNWLLLWYVSPKSSVKDRMLYASSLSILPDTFGNHHFVGNYQITDFSELQNVEEFQFVPKSDRHLEAQKYMTNAEREIQQEKKSISSVVTTSNVKGVAFPLADGVEDALKRLSNKEINLVVLRVEEEQIELDDISEQALNPEDIQAKLPEKLPRFVFYVYKHEHDGESQAPVFFVYVCPSSSKVNQRMIYSTTKMPLQSQAAELGLCADFAIETSDRADVSKDLLNTYAHPVEREETSFAKKKIKRPGKGRRRVAQ